MATKRKTKADREREERILRSRVRVCRILEERLTEHAAGLRGTMYALEDGLSGEVREAIRQRAAGLLTLAHAARTEAIRLESETREAT